MAKPFYSNSVEFPVTLRPITKPDDRDTHQDIVNIQHTFRSLLREMDSLFLGHTRYTTPDISKTWSTVGVGGVVEADSTEQVIIAAAGTTGTNLILQVHPTDPTPHTIRAAVFSQFSQKDFLGTGICLRNSTSGAVWTVGVRGANLEVCEYASPTTLTTVHFSAPWVQAQPQWYKIYDSGTSTTFSVSVDGYYWTALFTGASPVYDEAGLWVSNENSATPELGITSRLISWRDEPGVI